MSTSRRRFLTQTALRTGALLTPSLAKVVYPPEKKMGIALVGLGNYSTHQ